VREIAEIVVLGFVVAGVINAAVNKEAIARYLGGTLTLSNLRGATSDVVTHAPVLLLGDPHGHGTVSRR